MKYSLAALVALACASSSFAVTLGTAPAVTIAFTASQSVGGFKVVDPDTGETSYESEKITEGKPDKNGDVVTTTETKTVVQTLKVGNAEILKDLLNNGDLPDGTLKGWSIVGVRALEEGLGYDGIYAVKKGQPAVSIGGVDEESSGLVSIKGIASITAGKETTSTASPDVSTKISYNENGKAVLGFSYNGLEMQGVGTYSYKLAKGTFGKGSAAVPYSIDDLSGGIKTTSLNGTFETSSLDEEGNPVNGVIEGSISIAAEVVLDLETLGFGQ
jgi:hypothetical protein